MIGPNAPDSTDPVVAALLESTTFPSSGTVTLAVSGGPDSMALLALGVARGLTVTAVHVDHQLRAASHREGAFVAEWCDRWGATCFRLQVPVLDGPDLEARARVARHGALPSDTLFGHTADDQAETVVLRLLRGTGPSGLAAMRPERHPLLGLRRADTEALCAHLGVEPVRDPTNDDPRFTRNRVRSEVLPLLNDVAGRDVAPLLARLAALAGEQTDAVDLLALTVDPTDAASLAAAPPALAASAFRTWWLAATDLPYPPDAAAMRRVIDVARGHSIGCDVAGGWQLRRTSGQLRLVAPGGVAGTPRAAEG
ncbi:MAG: tRNA lysidine(34) synthetase TilS [Actinomycetes bacterium]